MQKKEGADVVDDIYSKNSSTNYGIWYLTGKKKNPVLKLQESGPGGFADVKRALDENKVRNNIFNDEDWACPIAFVFMIHNSNVLSLGAIFFISCDRYRCKARRKFCKEVRAISKYSNQTHMICH